MAITTDDFNKVWASTSPLTPYSFSESQYKEGWNFIGSTPPSRQMWDFLQKNNDEKMQYLLNHFDNYLPLSGGTLTGDLDVTSAITCNSVTSNRVNVRSGSVAPVNTLQRSTAYSVDDIVYTSALNAKYYLLCVTAGTTSATMPSLSGAGSNAEVTDGTVVWRVQTITSQESQETDIANISTGLTQAETRISALETNKVDKAGNAWVVESYRNGTSWYRVWSDGWIEQGGYFEKKRDTALTVTFLKPYVDNEYTFACMIARENGSTPNLTTKTTTGFSMETASWDYDMYWRTEGKGA